MTYLKNILSHVYHIYHLYRFVGYKLGYIFLYTDTGFEAIFN
jgi:hypothetical protein